MIKRKGNNNKENKKKSYKRKSFFKRIFLLFLVALLTSLLSYFLLFNSIFNINEVEVQGAVSLDPDIILEIADIQVGENIFLQNNLSRENNIKNSFNIIESVKIKQELPNKVIIEVNEKSPQLVLTANSSYLLISENGEVLDNKDKLNNLDIPLLTGINLQDSVSVGQVIVKQDVRRILDFIKMVPEDKLYLVGEVSIVDDNIVIFPKGSYMVIIGDSDNVEKKMLTLEALINDTNILVNSIDYIDITNPEKIIKKTKEGIS